MGPVAFLAGAAIIAVAMLIGASLSSIAERDWHVVATIDNVPVDRATLRDRMVLDAAIAEARAAHVRTLEADGVLTRAEAGRLIDGLLQAESDPVAIALDGIITDEVIIAAARREGFVPSAAIDMELRRATGRGLAVELRRIWVQPADRDGPEPPTEWPTYPGRDAPTPAIREAALAAAGRVGAALEAGDSVVAIFGGLEAAGWSARTGESWVPTSGRMPGAPDELVALAQAPGLLVGDVIGPVPDALLSGAAVGLVLAVGETENPIGDSIVRGSGVAVDALERWAMARSSERAVREGLVAKWSSGEHVQHRAAEFVISVGVDGELIRHVAVSHLLLGDIDRASAIRTGLLPQGSTTDDLGQLILRQLGSQSPTERTETWSRWLTLADSGGSGELGFVTKDELPELIREPVFAPTVVPGDVIGPLSTPLGEELLFVRGAFDADLDERSSAALLQALLAPDFETLGERIGWPGTSHRTVGGLWRASDEVIGSAALRAAYVDAPIGGPAVPVVLGDETLAVKILERRTATLDDATVARLMVRGFESWLSRAITDAEISRDEDPLPLAEEPVSTSPEATIRPRLTPVLPSIPNPTAGR
jgi:hypothetical protein